MAATVTAQPVSPASAYRPLAFTMERTDPAFTDIVAIYVADGTLALALGNDVEVGDVLIQYTGTIDGPVAAAVGQTILTNNDCGPYSNTEYTITNLFTDGPNNYLVVDAPELGTYDPAPTDAAFRIWLDEYCWLARLLIYTDPAEGPQTIPLGPFFPNENGEAEFDVSGAIRKFFDWDISRFMDGPVSGITTNAHGLTALFYRIHIVESYNDASGDAPADPFNGDFDILVDDTEDVETYRVAVNAAHPFAGGLIDWGTESMTLFEVGGSSFARRFLTNAPRKTGYQHLELKLGSADRFPVFMLTPALTDYTLPDFVLRVFDMTSGSPVALTPVSVGLVDTTTAAFAFGLGPADLSAAGVTVPAKYRAYLSNPAEVQLSEYAEVEVVDGCSESARRFAWMNTLGGVDHYTLKGRETENVETEFETVRKPYGTGTGFDFTERMFKAESAVNMTLSTKPVHNNVRAWLAKELFRSATVIAKVNSRVCPVTLLSGSIPGDSSNSVYKPVTIQYRLGVDNITQRT